MQNYIKCFLAFTLLFAPLSTVAHATQDNPIDADLSNYLQQHYHQLILDAEELFTATLYNEAIIRYTEIEKAIEQGQFLSNNSKTAQTLSLIYCRLGQIHFLLSDFPRANSYFERLQATNAAPLPVELKDLEMQATYMHAVGLRKLALYEQALEALSRHNVMARESGKMIAAEALYETGLNNFRLEKLAIAKEQFQQITSTADQIDLYYLTRLNLARIAIAEKEYTLAEEQLAELYRLLPLASICIPN